MVRCNFSLRHASYFVLNHNTYMEFHLFKERACDLYLNAHFLVLNAQTTKEDLTSDPLHPFTLFR
jgi:hypothetical protein